MYNGEIAANLDISEGINLGVKLTGNVNDIGIAQ